ncbi:methionyl-tRNA synthetase [Quaeritorhiza haematococci]|nr:methionyl-tRNA synthetase [Quaeritorhiza haematococci]
MKGRRTLFCTGTDEHGLKIQQAAEKNKLSPQLFCDKISSTFKELFSMANVSYTDYIRTTEDRHYAAVTHLWNRLVERGYIYKGHHEGWYSVSDETFYPETQVQEVVGPDGSKMMVTKDTNSKVEWMKEENYKFRLGEFRKQLVNWLEENPDVIVPKTRYLEVYQALTVNAAEQLVDLSVSRLRSRLRWGIPVPNDSEHVIYVWLDALTNYLTVTGYPWSTPEMAVNKGAWPAHVHVVGKDIIKFHAIYWPAFLLAAGLPLPRKIIAHAHWTQDRKKMSKSSGNVVDPVALIKEYGTDPVRYVMIRDGGIAQDAEFSYDMMRVRYQHDLGNQLGNLVMRCSAPRINKSQTVPLHPGKVDTGLEKPLVEKLNDVPEFGNALECVFDLIAEANRYWDFTKPWEIVKKASSDSPESSDAAEQLQTVLYHTFESIRIAGLLLQCVMPEKMGLLLDSIGVEKDQRVWENVRLGKRYIQPVDVAGEAIKLPAKPTPLFPRLK